MACIKCDSFADLFITWYAHSHPDQCRVFVYTSLFISGTYIKCITCAAHNDEYLQVQQELLDVFAKFRKMQMTL